MKIKDRIKELRRVKASELLNVLPCGSSCYAANDGPSEAKVFGKSLVSHPLGVFLSNGKDHCLCDYSLAIALTTICTSCCNGMVKVMRTSYIFEIVWAIVVLIGVLMVYLAITWAFPNKCFGDKPMDKSAVRLVACVQVDDQISGVHCLLGNDTPRLDAPTGSNATNTANTAGFIHASKRRDCFPCFIHETII